MFQCTVFQKRSSAINYPTLFSSSKLSLIKHLLSDVSCISSDVCMPFINTSMNTILINNTRASHRTLLKPCTCSLWLRNSVQPPSLSSLPPSISHSLILTESIVFRVYRMKNLDLELTDQFMETHSSDRYHLIAIFWVISHRLFPFSFLETTY